MPYLDAVLKEGLRMYPSVPAISRITTEDLELNGYHVPKGSGVGLHIYSIHMDPDVYPEPHAFRPERWLQKEVPIDEKPYCYVPFSGNYESNTKYNEQNNYRNKIIGLECLYAFGEMKPFHLRLLFLR